MSFKSALAFMFDFYRNNWANVTLFQLTIVDSLFLFFSNQPSDAYPAFCLGMMWSASAFFVLWDCKTKSDDKLIRAALEILESRHG